MNKFLKIMDSKNILLMFVISFCLTGNNVFASDNVLQAIQVDGVKDSYNIILKSDDVAELKKTVQAPNKMVLNLNGIRASKTINTIYNNTSSVDSVVVEPTGEDSVKISIQGDNVGAAGVHFDTLKTPLGVLDKTQKQEKKSDELILNGPMESYKPVYNNNDEEETGLALAGASASKYIKKILKNEKISWMITFGLFAVILVIGLKFIKGKDSDIKVGLTQSLKDREIDLYRSLGASSELTGATAGINQTSTPQANYGIKAYQQGTRSPYLSAEVQRPRPAVNPMKSAPSATSINLQQGIQSASLRPQSQNIASNLAQGTMQNTMSKPVQSAPASARPKAANIDSMKFLESMTKIYEKNGRSDLAQGLKTNMKKAKMNLT